MEQRWERIRFAMRSLQHRNYRLFFAGQGISLIGTWLQNIAISWLVYRMTNSPLLLGVVGFAGQLPLLVFSPFAGVLVDRWNRHRLILGTQTLMMLQALILAGLVLTGKIQLWQIILLGGFLGLTNAFDMPARQAFVIEMVAKEDLANAIALNSSMVNGARLLGPAIAGILIGSAGEGMCFLVNGLSYLAVLAALLAMQIPRRERQQHTASLYTSLKEGFAYVAACAPIRSILLLLALVSLVAMPYSLLLPVYVRLNLHGDAHTLGFLTAASGVGALTGALLLATRRDVLGLEDQIAYAGAFFGVGLVLFSLSHIYWVSLLMMVATGFTTMMQMAASNTIIQTISVEHMRGRVMSFYMMAFLGTAPLGSLLAGTVAEYIGVTATLLLSGCVAILGSVVFSLQLPRLREVICPVYVRLGILPETACGIQSATEWPLSLPEE